MPPAPLGELPHKVEAARFTCQAVVETPAGSRIKIYYDPGIDRFRAGKSLPLGMVFPLNFGFVPSTLAGDGDPIDLLILPDASLPAGCVTNVRILGILEAEEYKPNAKHRRNDRVIGRLTDSRLFGEIHHIDQLGAIFLDELGCFFRTYKNLRGQSYDLLGIGGPERAVELILEGAADYHAATSKS